MTLSMTAFSRVQDETDFDSLVWEIRSVNHRYLEPGFRVPELFRSLEPRLRELIRKKLARGKIECQLRFQASDTSVDAIQINESLVAQLINADESIKRKAPTANSLSTIDILKWPGVLKDSEQDVNALEKRTLQLFSVTLDNLIDGRRREGSELEGFITQRIDSIREIVDELRIKMPEILANQRQSLLSRLKELEVQLEPGRLEQEVVLLAQKADVDEELDRLETHVNEVRRVLSNSGPKGRRLDFLMQELNREANTLSSKSVVSDTTLSAVELKVLIEQMREQIQNIE